MTFAWAAAAGVIAAASFVMGLAGFGIALVAMAFLPYLMSTADAIVLLTIYAAIFSLVLLIQLRRDVVPRAIFDLLIGSIAGTPLGVWGLAALPATVLNRLIGLMLVAAFALPAIAGAVTGALMFERVDQRRFRQLVFALILLSGLVLLVRG